MPNVKETRFCKTCGKLLSDKESDRGTCHFCRSSQGKIAELDVAIKSNPPSPEEIIGWPILRHMMRERFGVSLTLPELWESCTDWLCGEGGLTPNTYLPLPMSYLRLTLLKGFPKEDIGLFQARIKAIKAACVELRLWEKADTNEQKASLLEVIPANNQLSLEIAEIQFTFGGRLPKPANGYWQDLLFYDFEDSKFLTEQATRLADWLQEQSNHAKNYLKNLKRKQNRGVDKKNSLSSKSPIPDSHHLIIAALTLHHQYQQGGCLNYEPLKVSEISNRTELSKSTVSDFFKARFGCHKDYVQQCFHNENLVTALKILNNEYAPALLSNRNITKEDTELR